MSESQENIEAKLIAYLEGEMDLGDRAEIERHLAANPTHRKLLNELQRTREFVVALPRSKAPAELVDVLQGQLERSALLDGMGADEAGTLRIGRGSRWPQVISVAAVVLLAVGLGAVVFLALPREGNRPTVARGDGSAASDPVATVPFATPLAGTRATTTVTTITIADPARAAALAAMAPAPATTPVTPTVAAVSAGALAKSSAAGDRPAPEELPSPAAAKDGAVDVSVSSTAPAAVTAGKVASNDAPTGGSTAFAGPTASPVATPLVVVVSAADIGAANTEVASYLASNGIAFENLAPPGRTEKAEFSRVATTNAKAASAMIPDGTLNVNASANASARQRPDESQYPNGTFAQQAAQSQQLQQQVLDVIRDRQIATGQQAAATPRVSNQYLAKRMSRGQVAKLRSALAKPSDVQLIEPPATPRQATVLPVAVEEALRAGENVEVTVDELNAPGVERTNRLKVADDGTINMPMLSEAVKAEGLTTKELADAVARQYQGASLIDKPTVLARRWSDVAPTTVQVAGATTTIPTTAPVGASAPSTQPATNAASTRPTGTAVLADRVVDADDDRPVDVMIVVQSVEPVLPTSAMATTTATTAPATARSAPPMTVATTEPATLPTTTTAATLPVTRPMTRPAP